MSFKPRFPHMGCLQSISGFLGKQRWSALDNEVRQRHDQQQRHTQTNFGLR